MTAHTYNIKLCLGTPPTGIDDGNNNEFNKFDTIQYIVNLDDDLRGLGFKFLCGILLFRNPGDNPSEPRNPFNNDSTNLVKWLSKTNDPITSPQFKLISDTPGEFWTYSVILILTDEQGTPKVFSVDPNMVIVSPN